MREISHVYLIILSVLKHTLMTFTFKWVFFVDGSDITWKSAELKELHLWERRTLRDTKPVKKILIYLADLLKPERKIVSFSKRSL